MDENGESIKTDLMDKDEANLLHEGVWEDFLSFMWELTEEGEDQSYGEQTLDEKDIQYLDLVLDTIGIEFTSFEHQLSFLGTSHWDLGFSNQMYYVSVPGAGYGNIAATFAAPFLSKIRLGSKVTDINQTDQNNAIISYTTSDAAVRQVTSRTVLDVINSMGSGLLNKCIMQWKTKQKGVPTLVAWIAGEDAILIESQSDDEILNDVMMNLRAMFPSITHPSDRVVITRWGQDDTIKGSYSFKKVGRTMSTDRRKLRKRFGRMWFAGEATASFYGTTEGAWNSGRRAALEMAMEIRRTRTLRSLMFPSLTASDSSNSANVSSCSLIVPLLVAAAVMG
ncbi:hypothetical protein ACHAWF_012674 [Thalassiosira exigua]